MKNCNLPASFFLLVSLILHAAVIHVRGESPKRAGEDWWSLQPLNESVGVPKLADFEAQCCVRNEIDRFIFRSLSGHGLEPSPPAEPRVLVRRLFVDLLGLPPDPDVVHAFERDPSDTAYEKLVDDLLASPHYGERWGRHWLDVVRYGESDGFERNKPRENSWHYRDWVINALNRDMPYDEFVRKQISGDLTHPGPEGAAAAGFLVAGIHNTVVGSSEEMQLLARQDELEEIAGAVGQTFLGLTVNCARCHDHKFDPITSTDYYRLISAIDGVQHGDRDVLVADHAEEIAALDARIAELEGLLEKTDRATREAIREERKSQPKPDSPPQLPEALAVWTFEDNYHDQTGALQGTPSGSARLEGGALVLDGKSFVKTSPLKSDLGEKTLAAWVVLDGLDQRGGGVISVAGPGGGFDSIVFGEQEPKHWMAGSEGFARTQSFNGAEENSATTDPVHVAITYQKDGTISAFRNGRAYGMSYRTKLRHFKAGESHVLIGLRHEPAGGNQFLAGRVMEARLYDRALPPEEIAVLAGVESDYIPEAEIVAFLKPEQRDLRAGQNAELQEAKERRGKIASSQKRKFYTVTPRAPGVMRVHLRGSVKNFGEEVTPGGIQVVPGANPDFSLAVNAPDNERRTRLAEWISSRNNPLLSRVMVNRVWHYHFGLGMVKTPSDLGFNGGEPSHPDLLEWLAVQFRDGGFRLKALHRRIVLSATYRQSSKRNAAAFAQDASNRLLWRYSPRRVDAEVLRDSILSAAGVLDRKLGGPGFKDFEIKEEGTAFYFPIDREDAAFNRRTVYRFNPRGDRSALLDTFDCPDPSAAAPARSVTTTPLQALSLMNNAFVVRMAGHFAKRVESESGPDPGAQIRHAWEVAFCRSPDAKEERASRKLVEAHGLAALCRALWNSNEWVYVE
jgi:hypothetical protein